MRQQEVICALLNDYISNDLDGQTPNPVFKVTAFLKSNIGKTARLKDNVTIAQEVIIPCVWNGSMFGDLD